jgi:peptidoglycan/LPS O-acetylase OafA/YrhL
LNSGQQLPRIPELDGLRGLAVATVISAHSFMGHTSDSVPPIVLLTSVKTLPKVCAVLIGLSVVARVMLVVNGVGYEGWLLMPTRMDGLAAGSLVAILQMSRPAALQQVTRPVVVAASLAAVSAFAALIFMSFVHTNPGIYASFDTRLRGRQIEIAVAPLVGGLAFAICVARVLPIVTRKSDATLQSITWCRSPGKCLRCSGAAYRCD